MLAAVLLHGGVCRNAKDCRPVETVLDARLLSALASRGSLTSLAALNARCSVGLAAHRADRRKLGEAGRPIGLQGDTR